ncbi:cytochrome P450 709B2-like isoform X1 [Phoenix dactylifera]|uniref:Cytochrome P450 709B2-like isoform X1 n=2 Tax=Phoenix dactylifera TaxID=42345 RepID=A0A8B9AME7_PHODC|nr:cytochrome P450 709B2-like isoform X1 [Phoenix dactylifera]
MLKYPSGRHQREMSNLGLVLGALAVVLISSLWRGLVYLIWRTYAIPKRFRKQGVGGPCGKFWSGSLEEIRSMKKAGRKLILDINSHDITPRVLPHYLKWMSQYGETFLYWFGPHPTICITDPELAKQVLSNKFGFFPKVMPIPNILALLGKGLSVTQGAEWVRHRHVVSPAFTMDKLKTMTKKMAECAQSMLERWQDLATQAEGQREMEVSSQLQELTSDVISHTAFGSSYVEGKEVFQAQKELQTLAAKSFLNVNIPGYQYLPSRRNLPRWKLERRVRNTLMHIIQGRLDSKDSSYGNDLLGLMMESCRSDLGQERKGQLLSMNEIMDECKTFFFVGQETTSHLLTWTVFLLCTNQQWQERLREEVLKECGTGIPNADMLSKLKLVTMVLLESLRLYGPVVMMQRMAAKDMTLGNLVIPKDTRLVIPIAIIHRNKEVWGADADEFNPLRFKNGISKAAKHPNALLAFSIGPRACIGQNFAMLEAKTVITMILQRFSLSLSPNYIHAPADMLFLQPQYGLPILLRPLNV